MLVNVPELVTAYFAETPDPMVLAQRVAFGTKANGLLEACLEGAKRTPFQRTLHASRARAIRTDPNLRFKTN